MSTIGLSASLMMGARSLAAQRAAIETTGHNIANVNTPNYARQRVPFATDFSMKTEVGQQGLGVLANNLQQSRSLLLDAQIPTNISTLSYLEEKANLLTQVEANLGQPLDRLNSVASAQSLNSSDGLAEALDGFFNAFQALSADPTSTVLRQQVILNAQGVARKLNSVDKNLINTQNQIVSQISQEVTDINSSLSDIAKLNGQISMIEVGGRARANDLRDGRQQMVEELSKHIDLNTQEQADGSLTVRLGSAAGALLVSGAYSGNTASAATVKLAVDGAAPTLDIKSWTGGEAEVAGNLDAVAPQPASGTLAARIEAVNTIIGSNTAGLIQDYDRIAASLAALVNAQHAVGFTLEGSPLYATTGNPTFFDDDAVDGNPLGVVTAANIQLNSVVANDIRKVAASDTAGEPSNRANAQRIAQLRDNTTAPLLGGMTLSNYYLTSLTGLGVSLRVTNNQKATQDLLNQQLVNQRDSVMGVSIDEEMTNMIRFQNAFEASARFISTIDEMMQLINSLKR